MRNDAAVSILSACSRCGEKNQTESERINDMDRMIERAHKCMFKCAYTRAVAQSQNTSLVSHFDRVSHSSLGIFVRGRFCWGGLQCLLHGVHFHAKASPVAFAQRI